MDFLEKKLWYFYPILNFLGKFLDFNVFSVNLIIFPFKFFIKKTYQTFEITKIGNKTLHGDTVVHTKTCPKVQQV